MIRPSPLLPAGFVVFGLLSFIPAVADGVPVIGRVLSWIVIGMAPVAVFVVARTWVRIADGEVEVGRPRGSKVFKAGQASVREFAVPDGVIRDSTAVHIEGSDGSSVTIPLGIFRRSDRADLVRSLRETLSSDAHLGMPG